VGDRRSEPQRIVQAKERERSRIRDQFGVVLVLLMVTVFFTISAPNAPWAWLATTATLAASLTIAMVASGARKRTMRAGVAVAASGLGMSVVFTLTQVEEDARRFLSVTSLLLTVLATGAVGRRLRLHAEINMLTILAAVCVYVLLGLSFAFAFECVGEFGPKPFFTAHEAGTRSDYTYFSFVTLATVGYGDLTAAGGIGRALAVLEGLLGQIYLVTTVAALVSNLGRARTPLEEVDDGAPERDENG
jgi:Ion channel